MRIQMHFTTMAVAFLIVAISCTSIGFGNVIPGFMPGFQPGFLPGFADE